MNSYENKNIIQFDTIKFRTKINFLKQCHIKFNEQYNPNNGELAGLYYNSKNDNSIPFDLYIAISQTKQSMTIEFSSKILLDDYPKLISIQTFRKCLENINLLGICELDIDSICQDCFFTKIHVTKDISMELTNQILEYLNSLVNNYRRYKWEHYENEGIRFTKDVKSKCCKESIVIYNKELEITLSKNKKFLSLLADPNKTIQYFNGKTRFEAEFDSMEKIKNVLKIPNTHIDNIFSSPVNPLLNQFNKIFGYGDSQPETTLSSPEEYLLKNTILLHNHDLKRIEQDLKNCYSSNSRYGLTKKMAKIRQLSFNMLNQKDNQLNILAEIREQLQNQTIYI